MRSYIWESASKPMFVKSVWLDSEGYHRVILDRELPKKKEAKVIRRTCSERCLVPNEDNQMLQCIGMSDIGMARRKSLKTPQKLCKKNTENSDISFLTMKHQLKKQGKKGGYRGQHEAEVLEPPSSAFVDTEKNKPPMEKNQLTERVLQWLDKSGKNTMIRDKEVILADIDELVRKSSEYSKRKSATLRRAESVHHLHLTFNDADYIPDPYVSGRCKSAAFDQFNRPLLKKSISLNLARKQSSSSSSNTSQQPTVVLQAPSPHSLIVNLNNLNLGTESDAKSDRSLRQQQQQQQHQRVTAGGGTQRKNRKILKRKDTLIENQYKHLIHKHILETTCNTQEAKLQLHIFIPKLKKQSPAASDETQEPDDISVAGQRTVNDCESTSCISSAISEGEQCLKVE